MRRYDSLMYRGITRNMEVWTKDRNAELYKMIEEF